jgi:hypothetical protein
VAGVILTPHCPLFIKNKKRGQWGVPNCGLLTLLTSKYDIIISLI